MVDDVVNGKIFIPFNDLISSDFRYCLKTTQNGSSLYILKIFTNRSYSDPDTIVSEFTPTTSVLEYDLHFYNGTYFLAKNNQNFSNGCGSTATLVDVSHLTSSFYYRPDFHNILIIFFLIVFFVYILIKKLFNKVSRW